MSVFRVALWAAAVGSDVSHQAAEQWEIRHKWWWCALTSFYDAPGTSWESRFPWVCSEDTFHSKHSDSLVMLHSLHLEVATLFPWISRCNLKQQDTMIRCWVWNNSYQDKIPAHRQLSTWGRINARDAFLLAVYQINCMAVAIARFALDTRTRNCKVCTYAVYTKNLTR